MSKYDELKASLRSPNDLSFDDDRGVTEFRAFKVIGQLHAERVSNPLAMDTMLEVLDDLKNCLQTRRKLVL